MKRCPTPHRQPSGDLECPSCGRIWDFQEDPPLCDRRHEPDVDKANTELQRMREILKKESADLINARRDARIKDLFG